MAVTGSIKLSGDLYKDIIKKLNAPATVGTEGQVLGLNNSLNPVWMDQNGGVEIDDTAGIGDTDKVVSADKHATDHSNLLNEINGLPEQKDSTETDVDLDISDANGNVILRLAGGHIQTKNFDSSDAGTQDVIVKATEETDPDIDITDTNGNAIARFADGGFIVKQFDGRRYTTYSVTGSFNRTALSLTINRSFKKGQKVVLHMEYGAKPWEYGSPVTYYEGSKEIASFVRGDSAYYEHIVTTDCNSISGVYSSSAFSRTLDITFELSVLGDVPIEPTVVTIKKDGTGNYTNLKDCLEAIGLTANDVLNPYRIEIYPGTYDVLDDYTDEEIANIHDDDDPTSPSTQEGFVGPKLLNGMSLVGIGDPSEIVLNGYLDTTEWTQKYRGQISTLNLQGTSSIENLTVIATNLRYCVHDDWQFNGAKHLKRLVKNCIFRGYNIAYSPETTYGAGCPISGGYYEFIDCDFGENAGLHASAVQNYRLQCRLVHCKGHGFRIGDSSISEETQPGKSVYTFIDCDFMWIRSTMPDSVSHARVMGVCGKSPLYDLPTGMLYNTGDIVIDPRTDLSVGDVVEWYADTENGPKWRTATSADTAHGVVVYEDSTDAYIQVSGYVRTDRVGITSFNLGDYVGLSSGSMVVINSATDAIGRIVYENEIGDGFIKLDWRE